MALWVLLLAVASYAGGLGTGWPLLQHVGYSLVVVMLISLGLALMARRGVTATVTPARLRLTAGEELEETISVRKEGNFPALWVVVETADRRRRFFLGVGGNEERSWQRDRVFLYRGRYEIGGDLIRVQDPFGLFTLTACRMAPLEVVVYPHPIPVPSDVRAAVVGVTSRNRWNGVSSEGTIGDLREYAPGDPPSRIHWRSTARTGTLIVSDPEPRRRRAVWLAVNLGLGIESADRTAGIAAYLGNALAEAGLEVGAIVAGATVTVVPPRPRGVGVEGVLDALARVDAIPESAERQLVHAAARRDSLESVVLISPATDPANNQQLRRMTAAYIAVSSAAAGSA